MTAYGSGLAVGSASGCWCARIYPLHTLGGMVMGMVDQVEGARTVMIGGLGRFGRS